MLNSYTVIIISWNVKDLLKRCLVSLRPFLKELEVIVVDNNSSDGSGLMVKQDWPEIKLIQFSKNTGFAYANNVAAKEAKGDYLVLLNPDTYISEVFFKALDDFWTKHPTAGLVGGQIKNEDGSIQTSVRRLPSPISQLFVLLKLSRVFPKLLSGYLQADFNYEQPALVEQVMGACFICPKQVWQRLQGFDNNFFVWFEEVDFCQRLKIAGFKVYYEPTIKIYHSQAASFNQLNPVARHVLFSRSLLYYAAKHFSVFWLPWLKISAWLGYIIAYVGKMVIKFK